MPGRTSVAPEKSAQVEKLAQHLLDHRITALVGVRGVPAAAIQRMRRELRARGHPILLAPNSAIRHAIEGASKKRPALGPLLKEVVDQTALLTAEGNPFALFQELFGTRSPTPARGGELAPRDIFVPAGTTSFKPGPIVGELQHAGFPAAIEKGKVVLKKDTTIVGAGQPISREVATLLTRMDILPLEVGLDLRALVDGETFYARSALAVDLGALRTQLERAHRRAMGLAVELGYVTPATLPFLVTKAHRRALTLAVYAGYLTPESIHPILWKAMRAATAVKALEKS